MAWILGYAGTEERTAIAEAGYDIDELTEEQIDAQFDQFDKDAIVDPDDKIVRVWVDCDVTDLLILEGKD